MREEVGVDCINSVGIGGRARPIIELDQSSRCLMRNRNEVGKNKLIWRLVVTDLYDQISVVLTL
jgi:hypothetical protein